MAEIPVPPPIARGNWLSRNWKWVVPSGCLVLILILLIFTASIFFVAVGIMKGTDAYRIALLRAQENPRVIEALGSPVKSGLVVAGSTHAEGATGEAKLAIPISGPKGKGTIFVEAHKSAGAWEFDRMIAEIAETKERIDLRAPSR